MYFVSNDRVMTSERVAQELSDIEARRATAGARSALYEAYRVERISVEAKCSRDCAALYRTYLAASQALAAGKENK